MKNTKLTKAIFNVFVLSTLLSSSVIYPAESTWSKQYNRFKITCAKKYKQTKSWLDNNKTAIFTILGLGAIGGLGWYATKEQSDKQLSDKVQQELNNLGPRYHNLLCNFKSDVGNYDAQYTIIDPSLRTIMPDWKKQAVQLPHVHNNLQKHAGELQKRINRLQSKQKTAIENGLLERMRRQKEEVDDLLNRFNNVNNFLQDHVNYFYLLENIDTLIQRYSNINSVDTAIANARAHYQNSLWPVINYCEQLRIDINNINDVIQNAHIHKNTDEYYAAYMWHQFLVKILYDLTNSSAYQEDLQSKVKHKQEQERSQIERSRVHAQEERVKTERERVRAIKDHTRAINRQTREYQKRQQGKNHHTSRSKYNKPPKYTFGNLIGDLMDDYFHKD